MGLSNDQSAFQLLGKTAEVEIVDEEIMHYFEISLNCI